MNKAVLISIHPEWCKHIFIDQDKKYEVRKRAPLLKTPYKVYVYCTLREPYLHYGNGFFSGAFNGLVMGEFICIHNWKRGAPWYNQTNGTCLTAKQLNDYANGKGLVFMEIKDPILYIKPKELKEFDVNRPPQSFQFIKELEDG